MFTLKQTLKTKMTTEKPKVKRPCDVFNKCPACECANLISVDSDLICSRCDWNSIVAYADALFDQGIGIVFESEESLIERDKAEAKKSADREKREKRLMSQLRASARIPVQV